MKVVIFGATGGIGKWALKHALDEGHEVTAFVRNPMKITLQHEKLKIFQGQVNNASDYQEALKGQDAVIWCIGMPLSKTDKGFTTVDAHRYLIEAMQVNGIKRVIDWATPSLRSERDKWSIATFIPLMAGLTLLREGHNQFIAYSNMYKEAGFDWTIVRFCMPTDNPYTGKVNVGFGEKHIGMAISREDIGAFMVSQLNSNEYIHQMPIVGS